MVLRSTLNKATFQKNSHPSFKDFLTIAENGDQNPPILIYNYPELELHKRLVGGALRNHTRVAYSAEGQLLASQSGDPDFILTIWKWQESQIILRLNSFSRDVYNLQFSSYTSELLTSAGAGHIKFWKICRTYTGLKCHGNVGRFGQTEISDIYGLYQLEDGKVLSGSDWGNILVWENDSIKYEVFRKNHKTCHQGPITQIICQDQDVLTISMDGYVRLWFWETVESSVPVEGENFVEVEPIYELKIGDADCQLMSMVKDPTPESLVWYIQDGNGGIWSCEITSNTGNSEDKSKQLYRCHAGAIVAVVASPCSAFIASLGEDGRLHLYNFETNELVFQKQFKSKGSAILWPSLESCSAGNNIIVAFASGVIRVLVILGDEYKIYNVKLIQKIKSHTRMVTQMSLNPREEILVTGSEDHSIFVHGVVRGNSLKLVPIGRVTLSSLITSISWNLMSESSGTVLIGCRFGEIYELDLPKEEQSYTDLSYELKNVPTRTMRFKSKKSEIKRLLKAKDFWYKKTFHKEAAEDDVSEDALEEDLHHMPPIPNKILWLRAVSRDVLWVCVAQFDSGYIYEYQFPTGQIEEDELEQDCFQRVIPVPGCPEVEINSIVQV